MKIPTDPPDARPITEMDYPIKPIEPERKDEIKPLMVVLRLNPISEKVGWTVFDALQLGVWSVDTMQAAESAICDVKAARLENFINRYQEEDRFSQRSCIHCSRN